MPFTLFTKHTPGISSRLRFLGRAFQWYGVLIGTITVLFAYLAMMLVGTLRPANLHNLPEAYLPVGLLRAASLIIIGRALLKRQRWSGYLAAITLIAPLAKQLFDQNLPRYSRLDAFIAVTMLGILASVRSELRSLRDSELPDDDVIATQSAELDGRIEEVRTERERRRLIEAIAIAPVIKSAAPEADINQNVALENLRDD